MTQTDHDRALLGPRPEDALRLLLVRAGQQVREGRTVDPLGRELGQGDEQPGARHHDHDVQRAQVCKAGP